MKPLITPEEAKTPITCICPSGLEFDRNYVSAMKDWKTIVMNYLKINRLYNALKEENESL